MLNDFDFSRTHKKYFTLLINIQLAFIKLQIWCSNWQLLLNI